jgi:hypothetical protein
MVVGIAVIIGDGHAGDLGERTQELTVGGRGGGQTGIGKRGVEGVRVAGGEGVDDGLIARDGGAEILARDEIVARLMRRSSLAEPT